MSASRRPVGDSEIPWRNEVALCGRLSAVPEPVALPSGDPLWRFRVCVERPMVTGRRGTSVRSPRGLVDAVDCSTSVARIAARLGSAGVDSLVEIDGVLTRRFWRAAGAPASRYEVVARTARVVRRGAARASV